MENLDLPGSEAIYAGFGLRLAAWLIDAILVRIPCLILACVIALSTALITEKCAVLAVNLALGFVVVGIPCLYAAIFESSRLQATPGKLLLKLKVADTKGQRCTFWRACLRNLAFVLSDLTVGIGYLMLCWTKRKQCLHDKIANCLVLRVE